MESLALLCFGMSNKEYIDRVKFELREERMFGDEKVSFSMESLALLFFAVGNGEKSKWTFNFRRSYGDRIGCFYVKFCLIMGDRKKA